MTNPDTSDPITEVAPDVYDLTLSDEPARYRSFLFDWGTPTLIDTGPHDTSQKLLQRLESVGIAPERLLLTHTDHDHVGGYDAVLDKYSPETYVPAQSELQTECGADHRYEDEDTIGPFTAVHIPGHTQDNYALIADGKSIAVLGDAMIGADWRGLPEGYLIMVEALYSDDLIEAERNAERLQEYEFDIGLVFHGSSVFEGAREKIDSYLDFPNKGTWD
jgi:glyoxylase-like metal-dependent hydrolase (beta-lactamase superfamily II)